MLATEDQLKAWMIGGLGGDAAAHARLLREIVPLLRAYYRRRMAGREADIEDLIQETLIAVHTRRGTYDRSRVFTAWLRAIARYKMIDHFRRNSRHVALEDCDDEPWVASGAEAADAQRDVARLLDGLTPKQQAAIRATHIEGLSVAEAAVAQGIGQSDVKISVHRGLKALMARVKGTAK